MDVPSSIIVDGISHARMNSLIDSPCPSCGGALARAAGAPTLVTCPCCSALVIPAVADGAAPTAPSEASRALRVIDCPVFKNTFALEHLLGRGASGAVFRAIERSSRQPVAVKILMQPEEPQVLERFLRECEMLTQVRDPRVVSLLNLGEAAGHPYLVTEFLPGGSLRQLLEAGRPVSVPRALAIARDCLSGLEACHARGIVHRDLKPENVLFTTDGRAKLADLGIAKAYGETRRLTVTGAVLGTPKYMAPEQLRGELAGVAADLYAMGLILYELLSGVYPFDVTSLMSLLKSAEHDEPAALATVAPEVPAHVARAVHRSLSKATADRPQSAADFLALLEARSGSGRAVAPRRASGGVPAARTVGAGWFETARSRYAWAGCVLGGTLLATRLLGEAGREYAPCLQASAAPLVVWPWTRRRWRSLRAGDGAVRRAVLVARGLILDGVGAGLIALALARLAGGTGDLFQMLVMMPWFLTSIITSIIVFQLCSGLHVLHDRTSSPGTLGTVITATALVLFMPGVVALAAYDKPPISVLLITLPVALLALTVLLVVLLGATGWRKRILAIAGLLLLVLPAIRGLVSLDGWVAARFPRSWKTVTVLTVPAVAAAVRNEMHDGWLGQSHTTFGCTRVLPGAGGSPALLAGSHLLGASPDAKTWVATVAGHGWDDFVDYKTLELWAWSAPGPWRRIDSNGSFYFVRCWGSRPGQFAYHKECPEKSAQRGGVRLALPERAPVTVIEGAIGSRPVTFSPASDQLWFIPSGETDIQAVDALTGELRPTPPQLAAMAAGAARPRVNRLQTCFTTGLVLASTVAHNDIDDREMLITWRPGARGWDPLITGRDLAWAGPAGGRVVVLERGAATMSLTSIDLATGRRAVRSCGDGATPILSPGGTRVALTSTTRSLTSIVDAVSLSDVWRRSDGPPLPTPHFIGWLGEDCVLLGDAATSPSRLARLRMDGSVTPVGTSPAPRPVASGRAPSPAARDIFLRFDRMLGAAPFLAEDAIEALAFTPDGSALVGATKSSASRSPSSAVHRWTPDGRLLDTLYYPDSSAGEPSVRAIVASRGAALIRLESPPRLRLAQLVNPANLRKPVVLWETADHPAPLRQVTCTPDDRAALFAYADGRLRVVDVATGITTWSRQTGGELVDEAALSADGLTVAYADGSMMVEAWDTARALPLARFKLRAPRSRSSLALLPGRPPVLLLADGSGIETLVLNRWAAPAARPAPFPGINGRVTAVAQAGSRVVVAVAVAAELARLAVLDPAARTLGATSSAFAGPVRHLIAAADGTSVAGVAARGRVVYWSLAQGADPKNALVAPIADRSRPELHEAATPAEDPPIRRSQDGWLEMDAAGAPRPTRVCRLPAEVQTLLALSPDGQWLAFADRAHRLGVLSVADGRCLSSETPVSASRAIKRVAFAAAARTLAFRTAEHHWRIWTPGGGRQLDPSCKPGDTVLMSPDGSCAVAASPNELHVVGVDEGGTLAWWKGDALLTREEFALLMRDGDDAPTPKATLSPDGRTLWLGTCKGVVLQFELRRNDAGTAAGSGAAR